MFSGWLVLLVLALLAYRMKRSLFPVLIALSAISLAAAFALLSPFLYPWDEQFHALVGKNLSHDMLAPKLYPYHLAGNTDTWLNTIVWMHKQPLFTWQMALSIKLLGTTAFAIRLPSVLLHGVLVLAVFRMGKLIFNRRTGLVAALLVMHSAFLLGLISGKKGTDHNDYVFLVYVTLSFWAWFEWSCSERKKWLLWIGVFAGCAILTKWLVGLLVFAGWGFVVLYQLKERKWKALLPPLISFGVAVLVALPWQIYTFMRFPYEAGMEMSYNKQHILHVVENHSGTRWYHYDQLPELYFDRIDLLLFFAIGLFFLVMSPRVKKEHQLYIRVSVIVIYLFFTIVQTKMPAFTLPVYGLVMLVVAFAITGLSDLAGRMRLRNVAFACLATLMVYGAFHPYYTLQDQAIIGEEYEVAGRENMLRAYRFMQKHGSDSPKRVVFGTDFPAFNNISWMYFHNEIAYPFLPSEEDVKRLQEQGYAVTVIESDGQKFEIKDKVKNVELLYFR